MFSNIGPVQLLIVLAIVLAMAANAGNADILRAWGVNTWFAGFGYGWPLAAARSH